MEGQKDKKRLVERLQSVVVFKFIILFLGRWFDPFDRGLNVLSRRLPQAAAGNSSSGPTTSAAKWSTRRRATGHLRLQRHQFDSI